MHRYPITNTAAIDKYGNIDTVLRTAIDYGQGTGCHHRDAAPTWGYTGTDVAAKLRAGP
ncbi:MAG: hypothetical protein AMXMBFR26_08770 [Porticoccaceae bacterium]